MSSTNDAKLMRTTPASAADDTAPRRWRNLMRHGKPTDRRIRLVTAQSNCSAALLFAGLQERVAKDVERRNALADAAQHWRFELHGEDADWFEVSRTGARFSTARSAVVVFERVGLRINVSGDGVDVDFTVVVGLNQCRRVWLLRRRGRVPGWEVRKMALEALFFETGDDEP